MGLQRWVVTGACGQLGGHVTRHLTERGQDVVGLSRRPCASGAHGPVRVCDVADLDALSDTLEDVQPSHILHAAGISSPAVAQQHTEDAWRVHADVTGHLARYAAAAGAWLVYPSSDFVWDGTTTERYNESDIPRPISQYAECKLAGEQRVLGVNAGAAVRLSLLVGEPVCARNTTWTRIAEAMERGETLPACTDEFRTPLTFDSAARAIGHLAELQYSGLVHAAGPEALTPYETLTRIARALGTEPSLRAISRMELPGGERRPRNVAMDASRLASFGYEPAKLTTGELAKTYRVRG